MHTIKEILHIEPFKIALRFENGEIREVDLSEKIQEWGKNSGSKFAELKDPVEFKKVYLDKDIESIVWENGIDLCPDVLYQMSKVVKNKNVA